MGDDDEFNLSGLPENAAEICRQWMSKRNLHPFYGEELAKKAVSEFWGSIAEKYEGEKRNELQSAVMQTLEEMGCLEGSILDVGSGPGTYAIPMAERAEEVVALDSSEEMLRVLLRRAEAAGLDNIQTEVADWIGYVPERKYDLVFSSLCPSANSPASLLRMEFASKKTCAYVSSMNSDASVNFDVWRKLGKNYSYTGYDTRQPYEFLVSMGRKPFFSKIQWTNTLDIESSELIEREIASFSIYPDIPAEKIRIAAEEAVTERYGSGKIKENTVMKAGILVWDIF